MTSSWKAVSLTPAMPKHVGRENKWRQSLRVGAKGSGAQALEPDRPGCEALRCHLQPPDRGRWLRSSEPPFLTCETQLGAAASQSCGGWGSARSCRSTWLGHSGCSGCAEEPGSCQCSPPSRGSEVQEALKVRRKTSSERRSLPGHVHGVERTRFCCLGIFLLLTSQMLLLLFL